VICQSEFVERAALEDLHAAALVYLAGVFGQGTPGDQFNNAKGALETAWGRFGA